MIEQIPVTIRIPQTKLTIIDLYAKEQNLNRSDLLRNFISNMIDNIEKQKLKDKLIAASKKVSKNSLIENKGLEETIEDGLKSAKQIF